MKKTLIILLSCIITLSVTAQTIRVTFNGANKTKNYQVVLDGTSYYSNSVNDPNSNNANIRKEITLTNQQLGSHTLQVYRLRNNGGTYSNGTTTTPYGNAIYSNRFRLRQGYDMDIVVNGNGRVMFSEKNTNEEADEDEDQSVSPVSDAVFDQLLQSVRSKYLQSSKVTEVRNAFLNKANYFTTEQASQLLSLITSESNKLSLAKLVYPRVTDPSNFTQLYEVFASEDSKNEMNIFIRNNSNTNNTTTSNNTTRSPMANNQFSQLLQTVNSQYGQSGRYTTISGAFNNSNNYFTTSQVRQLLSLINSESERLVLAKQCYLRVSDPANFATLYDLFYNQSSKNDLNNYVIQNGGSTTYNNNNNNTYKTPMADYQFSQLLQTVNSQYNQSVRYNTISGAINNGANYFTTSQVKQLLSLINSESDKLALAKQSYLRVSDPANFTTLYDLFYNQSNRNDLNNYVIQNGGTSTYSNTQYNTRTPMPDATFSQVLQKVSNHFLPWDKVRDAREAFNNTSYYFVTSQIRQILDVIASQNDRLDLAKLAWSRVADPSNFTQLFDLFTTQAYRDDLNAYMQAHPY